MKTSKQTKAIAATLIVVLLCGRGARNGKSGAENTTDNGKTKTKSWRCGIPDDEIPQFEAKFPLQKVSVYVPWDKKGCDSILEYSSFEEAEWKLINFYRVDVGQRDVSEYFDYHAFCKIVMSDPSSMNYPFDSIQHYTSVWITGTDDGNIRFYTWESPFHGTMSAFSHFVQYKWNGKVMYQDGENDELDEMLVNKVYTIQSGASTYYLTSNYFREWSSLAYESVNSFVLTKKGLKSIDLFKL